MDRRTFLATLVGSGAVAAELGLTAYNLAGPIRSKRIEDEAEASYSLTFMYEVLETHEVSDKTRVLRWFEEFLVHPACPEIAALAVSSWIAEGLENTYCDLSAKLTVKEVRLGIVDADVTFTYDQFYLPHDRFYNNAVYQLGNVYDMRYVLDTLDTPSGRVARQQSKNIALLIAKTPRHRFFA